MTLRKIGVLVCDDSAMMRRALKMIVQSDNDLAFLGAARDGFDAVEKAEALKPDIITMDINMPGQDGITALQQIVAKNIAPVIMVSSLSQEGAVITFEALELGAFDYVAKPGGTVSKNMDVISAELISKIKQGAAAGVLKKLKKKRYSQKKTVIKPKKYQALNRIVKKQSGAGLGFKAIAFGISTGGPKTLFNVLPYLPKELNAAVFLVQHMPALFTASFASRINASTKMECVEVKAGMVVKPGTIYLAKGGYHLTLFKKSDGAVVTRTPNKPEHLFIPSVDIMMRSVLSIFRSDTIGVLMTGMGSDGARQMVEIKNAGGITIAESEESAIVFGMPCQAIKMDGAMIVAPSWEIANEIIQTVRE